MIDPLVLAKPEAIRGSFTSEASPVGLLPFTWSSIGVTGLHPSVLLRPVRVESGVLRVDGRCTIPIGVPGTDPLPVAVLLRSSLIPLNSLTLSPTLTTPNSRNSSCPRSRMTVPVISLSLNAGAWWAHLYCVRKAAMCWWFQASMCWGFMFLLQPASCPINEE